ncbi:ribonucleotide-diphosphate reductase subunit beta [Deinococcus radiophilus]|uniref:ribonucleotide-diphosphate reductase subunit beta n=1 Tax=Deinococcus radiophilus TaxID=32062 RepID=UPI003609CA84
MYVALLAQEKFAEMNEAEQAYALAWYEDTLMQLYRNELAYTEMLYADVGLVDEVKKFIRYNCNVLADNLGVKRSFEDEEINPIVRNGIKAKGTTHDFFSAKGNSYAKIAVEALTEDDLDDIWPEPRRVTRKDPARPAHLEAWPMTETTSANLTDQTRFVLLTQDNCPNCERLKLMLARPSRASSTARS